MHPFRCPLALEKSHLLHFMVSEEPLGQSTVEAFDIVVVSVGLHVAKPNFSPVFVQLLRYSSHELAPRIDLKRLNQRRELRLYILPRASATSLASFVV